MSTQEFQSKVEMNDDLLVKGNTTLEGPLTRQQPKIIFDWNYVECSAPVFSQIGTSGDGVLADGDQIAAIFPGKQGQSYHATGVSVGAFTAVGKSPQVDGSLVTPDTAGTAAGLDVQMDRETADNVGIQLIPGASPVGGPSALTVGTHSGFLDVTFHTADYTDFDCVVIGYRKVEDFETGYNAIAAAGGTGDVVYTDVAAIGAMTDTDIRTQTDKNNSGTSVLTDVGVVPVDNQNMRLRISVSAAGAVTYSHVNNAVAGAGTLAAPSGVAAFSFDSGDVIIPFIATLGKGTGTDQLSIKAIQVQKSPGGQYND